jgi:hypothetical protein
MGLLKGLLKIAEGTVKTGIGIVADVATLGTNAVEDEPYTKKGLRKLKEGFDETMED